MQELLKRNKPKIYDGKVPKHDTEKTSFNKQQL